MAAILHFSFQNNPLSMTALHRLRYYYDVLSMHNQKRNKLLSARTWLPPDYRTTLILQTKILKKETHSAPEYTRGPRQGDIFCPGVYSGASFKGLSFNTLHIFVKF